MDRQVELHKVDLELRQVSTRAFNTSEECADTPPCDWRKSLIINTNHIRLGMLHPGDDHGSSAPGK